MTQLYFQQSTEIPSSSPVGQNGDTPEVSTFVKRFKTVKEPSIKLPHKTRLPDWNSERTAQKEIIVPFDESSFSGLLVDNKTFQDAYSVRTPAPHRDNLRLDAGRTIGTLVNSPGFYDDLIGCFSAVLLFVEVMLPAWTAAFLLYHFPISKWLAWSLISFWGMTLITFKLFIVRPKSFRVLLWSGASAVTLLWLLGSP